MNNERVAWVDYAKGICITLVVLMHSFYGVEKVAPVVAGIVPGPSAIDFFVAWAQPFRMPDFFMVSGLFLASRINRPWPGYLDSKLVHFVYFYLLWMSIQLCLRAPGLVQDSSLSGLAHAYLLALIEPFGSLWFIYLLAIFFVVTKATRKVPHLIIWLAAAGLEAAPIDSHWTVIDEFSHRFVYFYSGYIFAPLVFSFAAEIKKSNPLIVLLGLAGWAEINSLLVAEGWARWPGISLIAGYMGTTAVVTTAVLLAKFHLFRGWRYMGQHSLVIYLAFTLFMAPARYILLKTMPFLGLTVISLMVMVGSILGALSLYWLVRGTPASFLFKRPAWARLETWEKRWHSVSHERESDPKAIPSPSPEPRRPSLSG